MARKNKALTERINGWSIGRVEGNYRHVGVVNKRVKHSPPVDALTPRNEHALLQCLGRWVFLVSELTTGVRATFEMSLRSSRDSAEEEGGEIKKRAKIAVNRNESVSTDGRDIVNNKSKTNVCEVVKTYWAFIYVLLGIVKCKSGNCVISRVISQRAGKF